MAWWHSQDEERWNGPEDTREGAIQAGKGDYNGEAFMVMEAENGSYHMRPDGGRLVELLDEMNEDMGDPDGDSPFHGVTAEQQKALEEVVGAAIVGWVTAYSIKTDTFRFVHESAIENIPADPDAE